MLFQREEPITATEIDRRIQEWKRCASARAPLGIVRDPGYKPGMRVRRGHLRKVGVVAWCAALAVVLLMAGCGDDEDESAMNGAPRVRGVIEGFYGPPYTFDQRRDLFRFLPAAGLNTYAYAPKDDPFHRDQWRDPYPSEYVEHFRELAAIGGEIGVRFVFTIAPGLTFDPATDDLHILQQKLASLLSVDVRDFCLLFDDIAAGRPGADPEVQADIVTEVSHFLRGRDPGASLWFISNYYAGTAEELANDQSPFRFLFSIPSSAYYAAYTRIPADVPVMWTGPAVFSERLTRAEAQKFRAFAGRPVVVWDNYPANDALVSRELFLGPYQGREPGLGEVLDGVLANLMLQPEAAKIPLWTIGRLFAQGDAYDPWQAWEDALQTVSNGRGTDALRTLAQQFQSHPFIGDADESPEFAAAADDFFRTRSPSSRSTLRGLLESFARNRNELQTDLGNAALASELLEPSTKLSLLGEAGLVALDLLAQKESGLGVDVGPLEEKLAAAARIPWLVGANTSVGSALAGLVANREAKRADVFADFFGRVLSELGR